MEENKRYGIIYKITSPSNKVYVGSTINFEKRVKHYRNLDCKRQVKVYHSFIKYGFENHKIEIIEQCDLTELYAKERHYGLLFNVMNPNYGLNLSLPADGENKGLISKETIVRMSKSQTGTKNGFYGKKHSEISKGKRRLTVLNRTDEKKELVRKNMSDCQIGRKMSKEYCERRSLLWKGRKHTPETKEKMRDSNPSLKLVLHLESGIYFYGTKDAATAFNLKRSTLIEKLNGRKPNNTSLVYA